MTRHGTELATVHSTSNQSAFGNTPLWATTLLFGLVWTGPTAANASAPAPTPRLVRYASDQWPDILFEKTGSVRISVHSRPSVLSVRARTAPTASLADGTESSVQSDQATVTWLHDAAGLTWEQLGRVFGVSRRAVHMWANGGRMNGANAEALARFAGVVRELPASTSDERRTLLLQSGKSGRSIVDEFRLYRDGGPAISGTPFTPDQLLGALHDEDPHST